MADKSNVKAPLGDDLEAGVLRLPTDCRLAAQAMLKQQFIEACGTSAALIDGSSVERIDTAALQLLVLFRRELDSRGASLAWRGVSKVLDEAASLLGVARILELPAAGPA